MSRTRYTQEHRQMRFEEAYEGWTKGRLTQAEAGMLLGQCERSFRRHVERYQADGLEGLLDKRLSQISKRRASQKEVDQVVQSYKSGFAGWNVAHFHGKYKMEFKGTRSYSWTKSVLQKAGVVKMAKRGGKHRIKRERAPLAGMMVHQDASTHRWVAGKVWDLVVTMDDATGEHTSMFFCEQEGTMSSFHGLGQTIMRYGLFSSLYTDRGTSMRSKLVAELLADLDIAKTHSRPHVSDDNPYSEAQFKTLKYRPDFPGRFGSIEDARAYCQTFFTWYNTVHRHSGIGFMTPETVHYGRASELSAKRSVTLEAAFLAHPNRFKGVAPRPPEVPLAAWINPPTQKESEPEKQTD